MGLSHLGRTVEARFWEKVRVSDPAGEDACWLWTGATANTGYGQLTVDRKRVYVHRLSYEWHVGPLPDGLVIDHLCRVRNCVNPDHLEVVTTKENLRRGIMAERLAEWKAAITHCRQGHPFDEVNTRIDRRGWRKCRTCAKAHSRRSIERRSAERAAARK